MSMMISTLYFNFFSDNSSRGNRFAQTKLKMNYTDIAPQISDIARLKDLPSLPARAHTMPLSRSQPSIRNKVARGSLSHSEVTWKNLREEQKRLMHPHLHHPYANHNSTSQINPKTLSPPRKKVDRSASLDEHYNAMYRKIKNGLRKYSLQEEEVFQQVLYHIICSIPIFSDVFPISDPTS